MNWRDNTGHRPNSLMDKDDRHHSILANGQQAKGTWAASTTRWTITGSDFDVKQWSKA